MFAVSFPTASAFTLRPTLFVIGFSFRRLAFVGNTMPSFGGGRTVRRLPVMPRPRSLVNIRREITEKKWEGYGEREEPL